MSSHPSSDLCPLCKQRALALNAAGTVLACAACGAKADFDDAARRVRYTVVPKAYAPFDEALRNRWLTRSEVFDVVAASSQPQAKRLWPWVTALVLFGGVGVIGLAVALTRGVPAQPQVRVGSTSTAKGQSASTISTAVPTAVATVIPPAPVAVPPTDVSSTRQSVQAEPATPVATQSATPTSISTTAPVPTPTAQPQPGTQIALPTVDAQRNISVATAQPPSTPTAVLGVALAATATVDAPDTPIVSANTPTVITPVAVAQEPLPIGSVKSTSVATPASKPTQAPTEIVPTETAVPTETPIPTQTPVPATLSISKIIYVGGSTFEEYLELTNSTDQVMELPIQSWKMHISTAFGETELKLGQYLAAPFSIPARQSCRVYTSKRAASPDETSLCGFLTLGIADDVDGIYPDRPGATVALLNGESRIVASFRY